MDVNKFNVTQVIELHLRLIEIEREAHAAGNPNEALKAVDTLLSTVRWVVGKQPTGVKDPLAEFDQTRPWSCGPTR